MMPFRIFIENSIMNGQRILMTGVTSGLGKVAALSLASEGAQLVALCRTLEKGEQLRTEYAEKFPNGKGTIDLFECDLSSFDSVREACQQISSKYSHLDQLILNAGVWHFERHKTTDGIEEILQVNLLSPALMIQLLLPCLEESQEAKIIITSSGLHQGTIHFEDLEFAKSFSGMKAYRQSKLGVIIMCRLLHTELKEKGIGIYCQHPGVVQTQLGRHAGWLSRAIFKLIGKSPEKGAQTLLYLARKPKTELLSGEYYADRKVTKTTKESNDMQLAKKLMDVVDEYIKE